MNKCSHCGKQVSLYARICPNCGNTLNDLQGMSIAPFAHSNRNRHTYVSAFIIIIFFIISLFILFCSCNAYTAAIGLSKVTFGAIIFPQAIANHVTSTIITVGILSLIFSILFLTLSIFMIRKCKRLYMNK